ncbi:MAG: Nif3-like dinuclear metal center hexameric protein [Lachnospiraceae bacterium]|nr:Nif3-like dinuclear metal center hexameric protein [Lachnospiraceae bacterium]
MKLSEIRSQLEELSPERFALSFDNVGLLAGRSDREVNRVFIAVDATDDVVDDAIRAEADLLLTHHPLIFHGLKRVTDEDFTGRRVLKLIENRISLIAMHTNFDVMGMADAAADELGLGDREVLDVTWEDDLAKEGIGRVGRLSREMTLLECAELVKGVFHIDAVRLFGEQSRRVRMAAVCPGSGKSVVDTAIAAGADVLITGDIDHHTGIDAVACGLSIIDAGHYGLEKIFIPYMKEVFRRQMPSLEVTCAVEREPFVTV